MKSKRTVLIISGIVLVLGIGALVVYLYLASTLYAGNIPIVESTGSYNDIIAAMPEDVTVISEEEYRKTALEEADASETAIIPEPEDEAIFERVEITDRVYNVLLLGDDARVGEPRARSDSMLLVSYNRDTRTLHITSFMRDMFVPTTLSGNTWNRINTIYAAGGPGKAINVINNLFSLDVQRYVIVRFAGVFALVEQLDGLDIELKKDEAGVINKIFPEYDSVNEGINHLNGRQVLAYSRMRHIGDGDFARTARQRYVLRVTLDKVLASKSLKDMIALMQFMFGNIETNIPLDEIITMGSEIFSGDKPTVSELRMPVDKGYYFARYNGASVLMVDFKKNITSLHEFLYGSAEGVKIPKFQRPEMDSSDPAIEPADDPAALPAAPPAEPTPVPDAPAMPMPTEPGAGLLPMPQ